MTDYSVSWLSPYSVPEPELRRRYQALRADRIRRARVEAHRELITGTLR